MSKNTIVFVIIAIIAGFLGGAAARELTDTQGAVVDHDLPPPVGGDVAELREAIDAMQRALGDLDQRIGQLTIDVSAKNDEVRELQAKLDEAGEADAGGGTIATINGQPIRISSPSAGAVISLSGGGFGRGKLGELYRMNEDDRWAKIREELFLDSYQETELKSIRDDMRSMMREMFKRDPETGRMSGKFDIQKMMDIRKESNERVKNLLSADQYDKFKKEGYGNAVGLGGGGAFVTHSISVTEEKTDK